MTPTAFHLPIPSRARAWLCACLGLLAALPAGAQGPAETRTETPAEVTAPAAIPLERIPERIEQARDQSRRAGELARPSTEVETVRQQLAALEEQVAAFGEGGLRATLARFDLRSLESEMEQVTALRRTVLAAQATLSRRAAELTGARDALVATTRASPASGWQSGWTRTWHCRARWPAG